MNTLNHLTDNATNNVDGIVADPSSPLTEPLTELAWTLRNNAGDFYLTLVHCNYRSIQQKSTEQLVKDLQKSLSGDIRVITLDESTTTLFTAIKTKLQNAASVSVLIVRGLESVRNLHQVLSSANKVREEFRKHFSFPIAIWVNDRVLEQMMRWAPDFKNIASTTKFAVSPDMLLQGIKQETDALFDRLLSSSPQKPLPDLEMWRWEAHKAWEELSSQGQTLDPTLEASLNFVFGREANDRAKQELRKGQELSARRDLELARHYYQKSLQVWQQTGSLERQGILSGSLGQNYYHQATCEEIWRRTTAAPNQEILTEEIQGLWEQANHYLHQCLTVFEQIHRPDLQAKWITLLGEILEHQQAWTALQTVAEQALNLHQNYQQHSQLAQDYCFLANVALHQSRWEDAARNAQQALDILTKLPELEQHRRASTGFLLLAQAQQQLGQITEAIGSLQRARNIGNQARKIRLANPQVDLQILESLHALLYQQKQYLEAFQVKHQKYSLEQQYGLRAFIGPGRLEPQRHAYLVTEEPEPLPTIAQEILASGRQRDVKELIKRIQEPRFKLTIIHGESGVGKSSLLDAGLVPALKQSTVREAAILPVLIRGYTHWVEELGKRLGEALREAKIPCLPALDSTETILNQLRQNSQHHFIVLIFDEFEEFFSLRPDPTESQQLVQFLCQCLNLEQVKLILSLREDRLHFLLKVSRNARQVETNHILLDNILNEDNLYQIGNLAPEDAKSIIHTLTKRHQAYPPELIDALVFDLAEDRGDVRPIELQIVGTQLEAKHITTLTQYRQGGPKKQFEQRYLDSVIEDCGPENRHAAELALYLLTDENDIRLIKTRAQLESDLKAITQDLLQEVSSLDLVLQIFVEAGLVLLLRESPADRYQLVHDYFVTIIRREQETRIPQINRELEQEKLQRQQAEEQRNQALADLKSQNDQLAKKTTSLEKAKRYLMIASAGLLVCSVLAAYFLLQGQRSKTEAVTSNAQALISNAQALLASNRGLDALVESLRARKLLRSSENPQQIIQALQESYYTVREFNRLEGHQGAVRGVSFSPKGEQDKLIATFSEDKTVQLWYTDGRPYKTLKEQAVNSISFSPDGRTLATAGKDGKVRLLCKDCGWECPQILDTHQGAVNSVSFSPDNKLIATAGADKTVKLWQRDGQFFKTLDGHNAEVLSVSFSSNSQMLASASKDGVVKLWNLDSQKLKTWNAHNGAINSVSFSPDPQPIIATAGEDGTVKLWNLDGKALQILDRDQQQGVVYSVSFSPDPQPERQMIATAGEDGTVKLWNRNGQELQTLRAHEEPVYYVGFSPDRTLATASADTTVKLWEPAGLPMLFGETPKILAISFKKDEITTIDAANTVNLWTNTGQYLSTRAHLAETDFNGSFSPKSKFSPNGQTIATISKDNRVNLWKLDGTPLTSLVHQNPVSNMRFSADNQTIATISSDTVNLWKLDGKKLGNLKHQNPVSQVSFSPSGNVVTVDSKNAVRLWDRNGSDLYTLDARELREKVADTFDKVQIGPNARTLAIINGSKVNLWTLGNSDTSSTLANLTKITSLLKDPDDPEKGAHDKTVNEVFFSPDDKWVVTTGKDGQVKLWSLAGAKAVTQKTATFTWNYDGFVENVWINPDDQQILMSGSSGKLVLWNWQQSVNSSDKILQLSCNQIKDYLQSNPSMKNDSDLCEEVELQ